MSDFSEKLARAQEALKVLQSFKGDGDLGELLQEAEIPYDVFAQMLMEHLPVEGMGFANKEFWFLVSQYLGPDWIASFKKVAAFMAKVDEF